MSGGPISIWSNYSNISINGLMNSSSVESDNNNFNQLILKNSIIKEVSEHNSIESYSLISQNINEI